MSALTPAVRPLDVLVGHYHEIGLKGRNRQFFEEKLVDSLRSALAGTGYRRVKRGLGRVVIDFHPDAAVMEAARRAARVFGIAYIGAGVKVEQDEGEITAAAMDLVREHEFESFAVRARRAYSRFPMTSQDINVSLGQTIKDATGKRVDLSNPDLTVSVEIFGNTCIVYATRLEGPGGLPVGVSGKLLALLSGGIDSPIAAWRMARRGGDVELVHFHGQPFTDPSSTRQATELAEVLARYQQRATLHLVPLADAQQEIVMRAPADLRVILYRRAMMRIAAELAEQRGAKGLVTGDSLGQVASQTIENITVVDAAVDAVEVLRPLIGMDKQEIMDEARRIGTYDISTRKHQDCCVLFEPRSPATKARLADVEAAETDLDFDAMVGKALAGIETREIQQPPARRDRPE